MQSSLQECKVDISGITYHFQDSEPEDYKQGIDVAVKRTRKEETAMKMRNQFWKFAALAIVMPAGGGVSATGLFEPVETPTPFTIDVGTRKQTFLDDMLIVEIDGISKLPGRPRKYPDNPIIRPDRSWELGSPKWTKRAHFHAQAAIYDKEDKIFKLWYDGTPFEDGRVAWCYAVSKDGYHWEKPNLGIVEFQGSKDNNILAFYKDVNYTNVIKTPHDPDRSRRYKACGEVEPLDKTTSFHGMGVAFSPDGIHWTPYEGNPVVKKGPGFSDGSMIMGWDSRIEKYVAYNRLGRPLIPQWLGSDGIRSLGYSESDDFIHWTASKPMLVAGGKDRSDLQWHHLNTALDGEFYVGLAGVYRGHRQVWDIFLLSSRDGFHWNWVDRHKPILDRGEADTYDECWLSASGPIVHDDKVWIFYGARSMPIAFGEMSIALATLPVDRYVGLLAGPRPGFIATRAMQFDGSKLMVDFDASRPHPYTLPLGHAASCQVRVAALDEEGRPINGFEIDNCRPMYESGVQEVSWNGRSVRDLKARRIRLRFELRHAALYSFQFTD